MKVGFIALAGTAAIISLAYLSLTVMDEHIDRKSAVVVERTLAANTIHQLHVLSEVESLVITGDINLAKEKLGQARGALIYILQQNCSLQECKEALRAHDIE